MPKLLIKYYPIAPAQELKAFNIDCLTDDNYKFQTVKDVVWDELNELQNAHKDKKHPGIYYYNNKTMAVVDAENVQDAINIFFKLQEY